MKDPKRMFGRFSLNVNSGINPPYSPAFPPEGECAVRTLEVMTRVDPKKIASLLATGDVPSPFEMVNDRVAFRFMVSPGHTMAYHTDRMFDLMVTIPVRYEDYFTQTHIYMYCSDPMGLASGRESYGYTKKDCTTFTFDEAADGSITGSCTRRSFPIADFSFTPDPSAPVVRLVDGEEQPAGEIHVRRLPHPEKLATAYADIVYRRPKIAYSDPIPGRVKMNLYGSEYDPIADLEPEILSAQFMTTDVYGGGFAVEDRKLVKRLVP